MVLELQKEAKELMDDMANISDTNEKELKEGVRKIYKIFNQDLSVTDPEFISTLDSVSYDETWEPSKVRVYDYMADKSVLGLPVIARDVSHTSMNMYCIIIIDYDAFPKQLQVESGMSGSAARRVTYTASIHRKKPYGCSIKNIEW